MFWLPTIVETNATNFEVENDGPLVPLLELPGPPDGGWGWVVCLACLFGNLTVGGICLSFGILLPSLKDYYGESTGVISLVGSILAGLALATCPIAAILTNKLGLRAVYMIGSLLSGISLLASTFSPNYR